METEMPYFEDPIPSFRYREMELFSREFFGARLLFHTVYQETEIWDIFKYGNPRKLEKILQRMGAQNTRNNGNRNALF